MLTSSVEDRQLHVAYLVGELFGAYAAAVDQRDFAAWLALFARECAYEVHAMENVREGLPLAYMMDDCRERMVDRVKMIEEVWADTVEPYDTRHIQQRTALRELGEGRWKVRSNLLVAYTAASGEAGILVSGHCDDIVVLHGATALFESRFVVVDNIPPRYLVYPV
ncbi:MULTISPECIES: aromatic-ring-hydroxylating dioxygenase subunit beta [Mycobacteriaceae]|uniref:aromatic-ring-hydroxylating dioxygenase subunit beta n=1 Tax=Mycobacteriaceae TaxID=1762 RepID=UPI00064204AE|nr:aromatic-ring-hydroxylating dioxygenase subunit beta [Mycobacterium sp. EPa45]AKK27874.1 aromatic-ring-hydroxylating dioxygenase [Mycobacterium sp. EPa45]